MKHESTLYTKMPDRMLCRTKSVVLKNEKVTYDMNASY